MQDWELLAFLQALKGIVRASNSVAVITFPASLLRPTMAVRWQHFADILLSVEAVLGELLHIWLIPVKGLAAYHL
jgi:elongator complex protein 4